MLNLLRHLKLAMDKNRHRVFSTVGAYQLLSISTPTILLSALL